MPKRRSTEAQTFTLLREAVATSVAEASNRHGMTTDTLHTCRRWFGLPADTTEPAWR